MAGDDGRVVEFFSSKKCSPCEIVEKILKDEKISFKKIDVDTLKGAQHADSKKVRVLPTIDDGEERIEGLPSNLRERLGK